MLRYIRVMALLTVAGLLYSLHVCAQTDPSSGPPEIEAVADDSVFQTLYDQHMDDDALQKERPIDQEKEGESLETRDSDFSLPNWLKSLLGALGPIVKIIFYVGMAAIAASILYFLLRALKGVDMKNLGRKNAKGETGDDVIISLKPDTETSRTLLEEADALASEGKYAQALHLLLFRSIEDIQMRRKRRLSTALTAREIGELDDLPPKPRKALAPIIELVEQSFFGGREASAENWATGRRAYEAFTESQTWT